MVQKVSEKSIALAKLYCDINGFEYDPDNDGIITTANTIEYLQDCGFSTADIACELRKHKSIKVAIEDLSPSLYNGSLIKQGAYYLHRALRLDSPAPVYDIHTDTVIEYPYYCEMKIRFTERDVLDFFRRRQSSIGRTLASDKADLTVIKELMKRYAKLDYVEPLDVILCSIEYCLELQPDCSRMLEITNCNEEIIKQLIAELQELESKDLRKVVPRRKCLT